MLSFVFTAFLALASARRPKTTMNPGSDTDSTTTTTTMNPRSTTTTSTPPVDTDSGSSPTTTSTTRLSPINGYAYSVVLERMLMSPFFTEAGAYSTVTVEVVGHSVSGDEAGISWKSQPVDVIVNELEQDDINEYMNFGDQTGDFDDSELEYQLADFFFYLYGDKDDSFNNPAEIIAAGSMFVNIKDNQQAMCGNGFESSLNFIKPNGGQFVDLDEVAELVFKIQMTDGCGDYKPPIEPEFDPTNYTIAECELISYHTSHCNPNNSLEFSREYFGHCDSVCGETQIIRTGTFGAESCGDGGLLSRDMTHTHMMKVLPCEVGMFDFNAAPGLSVKMAVFVAFIGALYRLLG